MLSPMHEILYIISMLHIGFYILHSKNHIKYITYQVSAQGLPASKPVNSKRLGHRFLHENGLTRRC